MICLVFSPSNLLLHLYKYIYREKSKAKERERDSHKEKKNKKRSSLYSSPLSLFIEAIERKKKKKKTNTPFLWKLEMNISASKFSSGCESGWTVYLDQSYISESEFKGDHINNNNNSIVVVDEDEEEDLSMVSDASSGPPHCHEDDREDCFYENASSFPASNWGFNNSAKNKDRDVTRKKKKKHIVKEVYKSEYHSCLDDTASSPVSKARLILLFISLFAYSWFYVFVCFSVNNYLVLNLQNKSTLSRKEALMEYSQGFSATHFKV